MWGHNVCNTNSPAHDGGGIAKDNVARLSVRWIYDAAGDVSATPAIVGGSVYFPDWGQMIQRVDAATGRAVWSRSVQDLMQQAGESLGDFYSRTTPLVTGGLVIFGTLRSVGLANRPGPGAFLVAIDKETAALKWVTPLHDGHPNAVITGSPVLEGTRLYVGVASQEELAAYVAAAAGSSYHCCTFRGSVVAVDVATGGVVWRTPMIRDDVYYANPAASGPRSLSGYSGNAVWSSTPVIDRKRRRVYVTTGNNYTLPDGGATALAGNFTDAVVALDLVTGAVVWARSLPEGGQDVWTVADQSGPDSDFGAGANLFTVVIDGAPRDLVGAGQKSGTYFALDADTGETVWSAPMGPGGHFGGIHWGAATDGRRIYAGVNNQKGVSFVLGGAGRHAGETTTSGIWTALDATTGRLLWQSPDPALDAPLQSASVNGPVAVVNGVVFGGSMDAQGTMFALDADNGDVLWRFQSGGTVYGGPAVAGGVVYWGSGYPLSVRPLGFGTSSKKLYAFGVAP